MTDRDLWLEVCQHVGKEEMELMLKRSIPPCAVCSTHTDCVAWGKCAIEAAVKVGERK
jgi:hypothetical protein